jgi:hypothetical protein
MNKLEGCTKAWSTVQGAGPPVNFLAVCLDLAIVDVGLTQFQSGVGRCEAQEQQEDTGFTSSRVQAGTEENKQNAQNTQNVHAQHSIMSFLPWPHLQV